MKGRRSTTELSPHYKGSNHLSSTSNVIDLKSATRILWVFLSKAVDVSRYLLLILLLNWGVPCSKPHNAGYIAFGFVQEVIGTFVYNPF